MTDAQALDYIRSLGRFGIRPGLGRVRALCEALGGPHRRLRCVHVAGTNGKGSTCAMLAQTALAAGLKTGLYTSPYVTEYRECVQIDGEMIPQEDFARWTETLRAVAQTLPEPVTEYEFVTALAFAWFDEQGCDVAVVEVGLGGRLDATNILPAPLCCVITKISLDHTGILGHTLAEIAAEKCGIIKAGCPVVTSCEQPGEALEVIRARAWACASPLTEPQAGECELLRSGLAGSEARLAGLRVSLPLLGRHMCLNALTAVHAARLLGWPDAAIQSGFAHARLPARMEVLSREPLVLLDGGHNPDGAGALAATLRELCPEMEFCVLCGMLAGKDAAEYLRILKPHARKLITVRLEDARALSADTLAGLARQAGYAEVFAAGSVEEALRMADFPLLVCGSFYLARAARPLLRAGA